MLGFHHWGCGLASGWPSEAVEAGLVLIGCDKACPIFRRDRMRDFRGQLLVHNEAVEKFLADVVGALGAVGQSPFEDTRPDRTLLVDEARVFGHATIANDLVRGDAKAEVLVPTIAEGLLIGWVRLDVRAVSKA